MQAQQLCTQINTLSDTQADRIEISSINAPNQTVIGGTCRAMQRAIKLLRAEKVRTFLINATGPCHTSFMKPAADHFSEVLKDYSFHIPSNVIVYSNVTGVMHQESSIKEKLVEQLTAPVLFQKSCTNVLNNYPKVHFFEIGSSIFSRSLRSIQTECNNTTPIAYTTLDSIENM